MAIYHVNFVDITNQIKRSTQGLFEDAPSDNNVF